MTATSNDKSLLSTPVALDLTEETIGFTRVLYELRADLSVPKTPWRYARTVKWMFENSQTHARIKMRLTSVDIYLLDEGLPRHVSYARILWKNINTVIKEWMGQPSSTQSIQEDQLSRTSYSGTKSSLTIHLTI